MNDRPCLIINDGNEQFLACPMVAKVSFAREEGEVVKPGSIVARAMRLGVTYDLVSPLLETILVTKSMGKGSSIINAGYLTPLYEYTFGEATSGEKAVKKEELAQKTSTFLSPMDGMFYWSSSPSAPPFVKVGQEVLPQETVGIIEVMKCFYPVLYTGTKKIMITKIDVNAASPVSLGQVLFHFDNVN